MREQRIDGWRPEPGRLAHGVADADDASRHVPAAQRMLSILVTRARNPCHDPILSERDTSRERYGCWHTYPVTPTLIVEVDTSDGYRPPFGQILSFAAGRES
jgi:hypothetical protein